MAAMLKTAGFLIGGLLGWILGIRISLTTGFFLGIVGSAVGVYAANLLRREYLP